MLKPLLLAALFLLPTPQAAPTYAGRWTLDRARSTGLPPFYATVKSHRLAVADSSGQLLVDVEIDAGRPQPDRFRFAYPFGGAAETTTRVRTPNGALEVPTTLAAARNGDGTLHLTITRRPDLGDGQAHVLVGTEDWSLSADGATLTIARHDELPQGGAMQSTMVFARE